MEDTNKISSLQGFDKDGESSVSSEADDEDLVLEGVVERNPDVLSSSSDDDDDNNNNNENGREVSDDKQLPQDTASHENKKRRSGDMSRKKKKSKKEDDDYAAAAAVLQVEFTFCEMHDRFFHGLKNLLQSSSTIYQGSHATDLTNLMIANYPVGTVISTEDDESNVFGFASVLNVATYNQQEAMQYLKQLCLDHCPAEHRDELQKILSLGLNNDQSTSTSSRSKVKKNEKQLQTGFLFHGRMINLPMEMVQVLHDQLQQDLEWAIKNAPNQQNDGKGKLVSKYDIEYMVRLAPCQKDNNNTTASLCYKYFDDELLAERAAFVYTFTAPRRYSKEEEELVSVIVVTKEGYAAALRNLQQMIQGSSPA